MYLSLSSGGSGWVRWLAAPAVLVMLALPGTLRGNPIWCSPFETENGAPVSQDQVADSVDNLVGPPGLATGSRADLPPLVYIQHGQHIASIPAAIDPAGQAASFAISTPDDRRTGINTGLRSDTGDLANNLTFEGYFFMPSADPITAPTFVGRRLATQKRSADDANSRLAIGIHGESTLVGYVDGLFDYEGFNYTGTVLTGQAGGIGWSGAWVDPTTGAFTTDNLSEGSLDSPAFPFTPIGARVSGTGGHISRPLSRPLDLSVEGQVTYLSALMLKTSIDAASADNLEIGLATGPNIGSTSSTIRIGMTSADQFFLRASNAPAGNVEADVPYFVVVKIVSSTAGPNRCFMNVYAPGDTVPTEDPGEDPADWLLTNDFASSLVLTHLKLTIGGNLVKGEIDEIRVGSTYESVTDPDAPIGNPGQILTDNKLSMYWAELVPGVEPEDPATLVNHLEFGTTTLAANTWYHFALTYDSQVIRWFLNGQQEGEIQAPPATELSAGLHPVGTARMAIANNRSFGISNDRGFYGVLDEIRIWEKALAPSEMLVQGGLPGQGLLWQSRFETNLGQPVTDQQPAESPNCIDNSVGPPNGTPAGVLASLYMAYGQPDVPPIPSAIDPAGFAEEFAFLMPVPPTTAINTRLPSNFGNLANAVTVQGYFNSFEELLITSPTAVGRRLVSMQRSASEGQARLGIGLAANTAPEPYNVLAVAYHDGAAVLVAHGTTQILPNTWYHFAMVYDGTDVRWYLNGVAEGAVLGPTLSGPGSANIAIGNDRTAGDGTRGFNGLLDKIVINDHVIDPSQFMTEGFDACLSLFCNTPFADLDNDGDVDQDDFAIFQRCYTGTATGNLPSECLCLDRNEDGRIDGADLDQFELCRTGAAVEWDPALTPGCNPGPPGS